MKAATTRPRIANKRPARPCAAGGRPSNYTNQRCTSSEDAKEPSARRHFIRESPPSPARDQPVRVQDVEVPLKEAPDHDQEDVARDAASRHTAARPQYDTKSQRPHHATTEQWSDAAARRCTERYARVGPARSPNEASKGSGSSGGVSS